MLQLALVAVVLIDAIAFAIRHRHGPHARGLVGAYVSVVPPVGVPVGAASPALFTSIEPGLIAFGVPFALSPRVAAGTVHSLAELDTNAYRCGTAAGCNAVIADFSAVIVSFGAGDLFAALAVDAMVVTMAA